MMSRAGRRAETELHPGAVPAAQETAGFAMIELLAALVIMALAGTIALPRVNDLADAARLERSAAAVAALLRTDRNAALERGRDVYTAFDIDKRVVVSGATARRVEIRGDVTLVLKRSARAETATTSGFVFHADGRSSGGWIGLLGKKSGRTITVNWLTSAIVTGRSPGRGSP